MYNEGKYLEALNIILQSKVEVYWKRQKKNDTYDFYLKTIFNSYVNSIKNEVSPKEYQSLNDLIDLFENYPMSAEKKIRNVYEISNNLEISIVSALLKINV